MTVSVASSPFLTGQFLLAMPGIGDPRFDRAVIAMCAHDGEGALGIGIGAVVEGLSFHDVLDQFEIPTDGVPAAPVHFGGPVEPRRGFVVHTPDWSGQDTVDVAGRWALSSTVDVLRAIAEGRGPTQWIVALGYAGWAAGQLDEEMTRHGWFNVEGDTALLYEAETDTRWRRAFSGAGIDPAMLTPSAGSA